MEGYLFPMIILLACLIFVCLYSRYAIKKGEKIIHIIPDMVFVVDRSFKIHKIYNSNKRFLLEYPEVMMGKDLREYCPKEAVSLFEDGIRVAYELQQIYEIEYEVTYAWGIEYFEVRFSRFKNRFVACLVRNITTRKKADLAIKQNQMLVNSVLDNIPFPVMLKDVNNDFKYIYWNNECNNQSGLHRNEILGKSDIDLYGVERGGGYQEIDKEVVKNGEAYCKQEEFYTPDGIKHNTIVSKSIIRNDVYCWLLVIRRDITDFITIQNALKETNQMNRLILDNSNVGFVFVTPDHIVKWENISRFIHFSAAVFFEKERLCFHQAKGLNQPCVNSMVEKAIFSRKPEREEIEFDGGIVTEIVTTPVWNDKNELQGAVLKIEDITQKKKVEKELLQAKENAEKSDRLKSAFLANISHEIRTPLNAIVGFSELLCTSDEQSDKEKYLGIIRLNNEALLGLVSDILDLSQIESDLLEFYYTDVDINMLLEKLRNTVSNNSKLEIIFKPGMPNCIIHTEENRLFQVINHLVANAVKFTNQGKIVFGYEVREKEIYFYVTDTGIGIPQEKLQIIFQRFIKLDTFKNGTGLGLTLCEIIVRKLKGQIGVISKPGEGSTFWLTLPCLPLEKKS